MYWRIINLSCYNVRISTHLHNLSDDEGMALRLGRKAQKVDCFWNVMANAQKPDFVFRRNGRVPFKSAGAFVQSTTGSRVVCISGSNAGYTMFQRWYAGYWLPTPFGIFPFTSPPVRHRVPSRFNWTIPNVAARVQVDGERASTAQLVPRVRKLQREMVISPANVSYLHWTSEDPSLQDSDVLMWHGTEETVKC